ncbi:MAG: hypothetical protein HZB38_15465 [Planctomycetes bacterium]|nr:hypothetical protein [Planctomycetota bacterium]
MTQRKRPDIVSMHLSDEAKQMLDDVCEVRGMTIKTLLGKLIVWFNQLDRTEQSIVLGQVESSDVRGLAEMVLTRQDQKGRKPVKLAR